MWAIWMEDECNYTHLMCGEVVAMDVKGWTPRQRRVAKAGRSGSEWREGEDGRAATRGRSGRFQTPRSAYSLKGIS